MTKGFNRILTYHFCHRSIAYWKSSKRDEIHLGFNKLRNRTLNISLNIVISNFPLPNTYSFLFLFHRDDLEFVCGRPFPGYNPSDETHSRPEWFAATTNAGYAQVYCWKLFFFLYIFNLRWFKSTISLFWLWKLMSSRQFLILKLPLSPETSGHFFLKYICTWPTNLTVYSECPMRFTNKIVQVYTYTDEYI